MGKFAKFIGWVFIIAVFGYVGYGVITGQSGSGMAIQSKVLSLPDCTDTDSGKFYEIRGSTYNKVENEIHEDYCEDENTLVEYFCNNAYPDNIMISCNCFKGECLE